MFWGGRLPLHRHLSPSRSADFSHQLTTGNAGQRPRPSARKRSTPPTRSARRTQRRDSGAGIAVVRAGAQDITDHYPNPQGAAAVGWGGSEAEGATAYFG